VIPFILAALTAAAPPVSPREPLVVTTAWLANHLHDKGLILFHIGDRATRAVYDSVHIPGAQFLAPLSEFSTPRVQGSLVLELPSVATLDSVLESKGISDDSRIVLYYAREYFSPTSRAFFTLEYMGLGGRVSILDGGLEAWQAEGRPVSAQTIPFLSWCCEKLEPAGKKALLLIWDNASWHLSHEVRGWVAAHNRAVKRGEAAGRIVVCPLPSKSPWLNPIEAKWVHGKRRVVEPARLLTMAELEERVYAALGADHAPHLVRLAASQKYLAARRKLRRR